MADLQTLLREAAGPPSSRRPDLEEVRRRARRRRTARIGGGVVAALALVAVLVAPLTDLTVVGPGIVDRPTESIDVEPFELVAPDDRRFDDAVIPRPQYVLDRQHLEDGRAFLVAHPDDRDRTCVGDPIESGLEERMSAGGAVCFPGVADVEFASLGRFRLAGVTHDEIRAVVVELEDGPPVRVPTQPLPELGVRAFVMPLEEDSRVAGVTAVDRPAAGRGDAILISRPGATWWVTAMGLRADERDERCVQVRDEHEGPGLLCASGDDVQLRILDGGGTLLIAGPPDIRGWSVYMDDGESGTLATVGGRIDRSLALTGGISSASLFYGADVVELEGGTGEIVATCERPLPEDGICPAERVGPRNVLVRLWQYGLMTAWGDLAMLVGLVAWIAGLVDAGRRRRWVWFGAIVLLNVVAVAAYAVVRVREQRATR